MAKYTAQIGEEPAAAERMKRPGYREAIEWLAYNDDCEWLDDSHGSISVSAALVRDLYGVSDGRLITDLKRKWKEAKNAKS